MPKRDKKGFTLAELLIVVAIIAVLTAIAVPLFLGAFKKAGDSVIPANERAVRGYAVSEILSNPDDYADASGNLVGPWYVTATVTASGEISGAVRIEVKTVKEGEEDPTPPSGWGESVKNADGTYTIRVEVTSLSSS